MTEAVAYFRVSSARQVDGASLDTQRMAIRIYAERNNLTIIDEYCDVLSGSRDDRPQYRRMLGDIREGMTVLVWRLDRVGRKKSELFRFFEECKRRRIALISVTQPEMSNELARDIMSVIAAYESQQIAERVLPNQTARAQEGRWVSRPPKWYVVGPDKHLLPAPDHEDAQRMFATFVATQNLVMTAGLFNTTAKALRRMIRSRTYLGEAEWSGIRRTNAHPAIVDAATWRAANAILDGRLKGKRRSRKDTPLLTGFLYVGGTERRLYRQPDKRGNHRYATRDDSGTLPRYSVSCDTADRWAVAQLATLNLTKEDKSLLLRAARERAKDDPHRSARARLVKRRASLELERDGTAAMLARGQIERARWERMDARQAKDLAEVAAQLASLPPLVDIKEATAYLDLRIGLGAKVWEAWQQGNVRALRILLEAFVRRIDLWTEPTDGKQGAAKSYWMKHPPRLTITWSDAVIQQQ